ncbi:uncharacterized protein LOC62_01G000210 [Vanrija pseudolonga]|uniref:Uncharacterized protein n=1 Tax=Vanrija pseudolonga TaxID=143232 RepID=A0AAF0Y4J9_9TREE|nr:hypothetical protein LOC62_01G000210 [Vanrija pseudolonga]
MPTYAGEASGIPSNFRHCYWTWEELMDYEALELIGYRTSYEVMVSALRAEDQAAVDQVYAERCKVLNCVYSVARVLLVVRAGELSLNQELASKLWGEGGVELCMRLLPSVLGFNEVDARTRYADSFLEHFRLYRIARYLKNNGWKVPGMTPTEAELAEQHEWAEKGNLYPDAPPFDTHPPCPMPVYRAARWGNPVNLNEHRAVWRSLVDTDLIYLVSYRASGERAVLFAVVNADNDALYAIARQRKTVVTMVHSVARLLLVYEDGKIQLNAMLAGALWGNAGYQLCDHLSTKTLGLAMDDAGKRGDPFMQQFQPHRLARYLLDNGWQVPGLTPEILASLDEHGEVVGDHAE